MNLNLLNFCSAILFLPHFYLALSSLFDLLFRTLHTFSAIYGCSTKFFTVVNPVFMANFEGDVHLERTTKHCKKRKKPVRGHISPHEDFCHNPSPQFVSDLPELANVQYDTEASIQAHQQQNNNLSAELQLMNLGSSTPVSDDGVAQSFSVTLALVSMSSRPLQQASSTTWSNAFGLSLPTASIAQQHVQPAPVAIALFSSPLPPSLLASVSPQACSAFSKQNFPGNSQNKNFTMEQLVHLFNQFLQHLECSKTQASHPQGAAQAASFFSTNISAFSCRISPESHVFIPS